MFSEREGRARAREEGRGREGELRSTWSTWSAVCQVTSHALGALGVPLINLIRARSFFAIPARKMPVSPSLVASMLLLAASAHARAPGPSAKPRLGAEPSCRSERDCEPEELVVRLAPAAVSTELLAASKVAASKAARSEGGGAGVLDRLRRRGARAGAQISAVTPAPPPPPLPPPLPVQRGSFWWAVLANWLSFFALGLSIPVLGRVIATLVNEDGSPDVSPASAVLSGDVEAARARLSSHPSDGRTLTARPVSSRSTS